MAGASRKFERIYSLGADRVSQIEYMMATGTSNKKIAKHIQEEWGEFTNVKLGTLEKQLLRYNNEMVKPKLQTKVAVPLDKLPDAVDNKDGTVTIGGTITKKQTLNDGEEAIEAVVLLNNVPNNRDVMKELNELIEVQKSRVKKMYDREVLTPALIKGVTQEIRVLGELLKQMTSLQLDTGTLNRVPRKHLLATADVVELEERMRHRAAVQKNKELAESAENLMALIYELESSLDNPVEVERSDS